MGARARVIFVVGAVALSPAIGRAQTAPAPVATSSAPTAADKEEARKIARGAIEHYEAGRYAEAIVQFRKANGLYPTPQGLLYLARCYARLGKLVAARDRYMELALSPPPQSASQNVRDAHAAAQTELDALRPRVPSLTVKVRGAPEAEVEAFLDDAPLSLTDLRERSLDPGSHVLRVKHRGAGVERTLDVKEGERLALDLDLAPTPPAAPTATASATVLPVTTSTSTAVAAPVPAPTTSGGTNLRPVSFAAMALGLAGIGVGIGTGAIALGKAGEIKDGCDAATKRCPPGLEPTYRDAQTFGAVSTAGFVAGGVLAATGAVLFFVLPSGPAKTGAVDVRVGAGSLQVSGRF